MKVRFYVHFIFLEANWSTLHTQLEAKCLKETCIAFQATNERWKKGRDENLANSCGKICKVSFRFEILRIKHLNI